MKNEILKFFANLPQKAHEKYNRALELYRKSEGHNPRQVQFFNNNRHSTSRLESLLYELKKLHNITEKEIKMWKPEAVVSESKEEAPAAPSGTQEQTIVVVDGPTGATTITLKEDVFTKAPDEVKTDIKLRDEFPFLRNADCPDELKILVNDKLNHYDGYVAAHKALLVLVAEEGQEPVAMSDDEIFALAKAAVENFEMNQKIYEELECYKNTGKILGKHPIFKERKIRESIENASLPQLTKRQSNLVNYINRTKRELEATVDADRKATLQEKLDGYEKEKELVDARLTNDSKK